MNFRKFFEAKTKEDLEHRIAAIKANLPNMPVRDRANAENVIRSLETELDGFLTNVDIKPQPPVQKYAYRGVKDIERVRRIGHVPFEQVGTKLVLFFTDIAEEAEGYGTVTRFLWPKRWEFESEGGQFANGNYYLTDQTIPPAKISVFNEYTGKYMPLSP